MSVEGRERYPIRVRYLREFREHFDDLEHILVPTSTGAHVPIGQLAKIRYVLGPQELKSENGLLVGYVTMNTRDRDEVSVVEDAERLLATGKATQRRIDRRGSTRTKPRSSYRRATTGAGPASSKTSSGPRERLSIVVPLRAADDVRPDLHRPGPLVDGAHRLFRDHRLGLGRFPDALSVGRQLERRRLGRIHRAIRRRG